MKRNSIRAIFSASGDLAANWVIRSNCGLNALIACGPALVRRSLGSIPVDLNSISPTIWSISLNSFCKAAIAWAAAVGVAAKTSGVHIIVMAQQTVSARTLNRGRKMLSVICHS